MKERWKAVCGYEGVYEVSDLGRIRRISVPYKLSEHDVEEMKSLRRDGMIYREIAERFHVSKQAAMKAMKYVHKREAMRQTNRVLKRLFDTHGYVRVALCANGVGRWKLVHILVCEAFLGPCPDGKEVNHKNGRREDAGLNNLEYISHSDNLRYAYRSPVLSPEQRPKRGKLNPVLARQIRELYREGKLPQMIGKEFGVSTETIYAIIKRRSWKHVA
jgi:HNH endonuclease/NUMOD4 motif-containing protein